MIATVIAIGASCGPSAGGTGPCEKSFGSLTMPPFSGFKRDAAGSLESNGLGPAQATQPPAATASTPIVRAVLLKLGRLLETILLTCQNLTNGPKNRRKVRGP